MLRLKIIRVVSLVLCLLSMYGCLSSNISDLEEYVAEVLARSGSRIKPLPEFKPYEAYIYQSGNNDLADPFNLFYQKIEEEALVEEKDSGLTVELEEEIKHRNKEELEEFELDSLRMVGTLSNEHENLAIIQDPNNVVHTVKVGNYIGRHIGKILDILENKVEIREIIKDSQGRWEERQASITLQEQE